MGAVESALMGIILLLDRYEDHHQIQIDLPIVQVWRFLVSQIVKFTMVVGSFSKVISYISTTNSTLEIFIEFKINAAKKIL